MTPNSVEPPAGKQGVTTARLRDPFYFTFSS